MRYFLAVAEGGSFTRAAKACGVSQPALTAAIKRLEGEFEGELFTRGRGGAKLTPLGEMMLPRMQRIAREQQAVDEVARNFRSSSPLPSASVSWQRSVRPALRRSFTRSTSGRPGSNSR